MMSKLSGAPKGLASRGSFKIVNGNECPVAKEVAPICLRDHIQCRDQLGGGHCRIRYTGYSFKLY